MVAQPKPARILLAILLLLAAGLFLTGIQWGLPSRSADPFLFGNRTPWTGQQILALAPDWSDNATRGADVAAHPLTGRDQPIIINQTDSQRAAIVRRYRLYSDQPDEMITLRALAQMKPGKLHFDPKLYQYGGLWIYPIGAILKFASLFHLVHLTPDLAFYLDHPEAFGRMYVVIRLYSAAWGLIGVAVMFGLAYRLTQSRLIGTTAAICYMLLPTVINGAHEAKPHLAGAVLSLIAVDLAMRAINSGRTSCAIAAAIACGAAASMVLSGWLSIGLLPVMAFCMTKRAASRSAPVLAPPGRAGSSPATTHPTPALPGCAKTRTDDVTPSSPPPTPVLRYSEEPDSSSAIRIRRALSITAISCATAALTYAFFNPYVILHLLGDRTILQSNLENSAAMYQAPASVGGAMHGIHLLMDGGGMLVFLGIWMILLDSCRKRTIALLLLSALIPGLCIFLLRATGKPGEYARFALPADLMLVLGAAVGIGEFTRAAVRAVLGCVLCLLILPFGLSYLLTYSSERRGQSTRLTVAERLEQLSKEGDVTLAVDAEPAPYTLPPVDLFQWKIVLLPRDFSLPADADVRIDPVDRAGADGVNVQYLTRPHFLQTPISWTAKPFRIETRAGSPPDAASAARGRR